MQKLMIIETDDINIGSDYFLGDSRISLKAKGLMAMLIAYPCRADFSLDVLSLFAKESENSIRTTMKELEAYGYLDRWQGRNKLGQMLPIRYVIYENPYEDRINPEVREKAALDFLDFIDSLFDIIKELKTPN